MRTSCALVIARITECNLLSIVNIEEKGFRCEELPTKERGV